MLDLYSVFHLNILFSSIQESEREAVLRQCYWPLLRLARAVPGAIAIEAGGYTLEEINRLDPKWIDELKNLIAERKAEFIGSGYAQVIGPLVPAAVNEHNLAIGRDVYKKILGVTPRIAYLNEQSYSASMTALYRDAGYEAFFAEWNNASRYKHDWEKALQYRVVRAKGEGASLPLIWINSIAFQKFQRYAHGELELAEHIAYLKSHAHSRGCFPLYGNDAEIFDFRPGRFTVEAPLADRGEWNRINELYKTLSNNPAFSLVLPSAVLDRALLKDSFTEVELQTPEQPILVKKQEKYNPIRWTVTGRDSIGINTLCYQIYDILSAHPDSPLWKDLCNAWDSDFRTHITAERFTAYRVFLDELVRKGETLGRKHSPRVRPGQAKIFREGNFLHCENKHLTVVLNVRRGLAIDSFVVPDISSRSLIGTIPHGYYDDITLGADFYSGNTTIDVPARMRITDLEFATDVRTDEETGTIVGLIKTPAGTIKKRIVLSSDGPTLAIFYEFDLKLTYPLSFRTGIIALNPESFKRETLFYRCNNGGREPETFMLKNVESISSDPLSLLVSTRMALGNTTGVFDMGDASKFVRVSTDLTQLAAAPIITFKRTGDTYFYRVAYSLSEVDDTAKVRADAPIPRFRFGFRISAHRK